MKKLSFILLFTLFSLNCFSQNNVDVYFIQAHTNDVIKETFNRRGKLLKTCKFSDSERIIEIDSSIQIQGLKDLERANDSNTYNKVRALVDSRVDFLLSLPEAQRNIIFHKEGHIMLSVPESFIYSETKFGPMLIGFMDKLCERKF